MIKKYCLIGLCVAGLSSNAFCSSVLSVHDMQKKENTNNLLLVARTALAIWGFSQNTTYGYVIGGLLTLRIAFDLSGEK